MAGVSICVAVAGMALAETAGKPVMHSSVFNWSELKVKPTKTGEVRPVFDAPTPALADLECHITTPNPGESPPLSHQQPAEELMIIREGVVAALQGDRTNKATAGGTHFKASNEIHALRNIGTNRRLISR